MDAPMYLQMFQELIAPDIISKMNWVGSRPRNIRWQDDNASPHAKRDMPNRLQLEFDKIVDRMPGVATMSKSRQVPRSPNCNVLELGANRSIGQAVSNSPKRTIGELHTVVMSAWKRLGPLKIGRLFAMVTLNAKVYAKSEGRRMKNPSVGLRSV